MPLQEARKVVSVWEAEFGRTTDMQKKMALLYLANDVLQNSRKRGTHFVVDFYRALPAATRHMLKHGDANVSRPLRCQLRYEELPYGLADLRCSARHIHSQAAEKRSTCHGAFCCRCCISAAC